jgi:hypothetical protein
MTFRSIVEKLRIAGKTTATISINPTSVYGESFQITDAEGCIKTYAVNDGGPLAPGAGLISIVQSLDKDKEPTT